MMKIKGKKDKLLEWLKDLEFDIIILYVFKRHTLLTNVNLFTILNDLATKFIVFPILCIVRVSPVWLNLTTPSPYSRQSKKENGFNQTRNFNLLIKQLDSKQIYKSAKILEENIRLITLNDWWVSGGKSGPQGLSWCDGDGTPKSRIDFIFRNENVI